MHYCYAEPLAVENRNKMTSAKVHNPLVRCQGQQVDNTVRVHLQLTQSAESPVVPPIYNIQHISAARWQQHSTGISTVYQGLTIQSMPSGCWKWIFHSIFGKGVPYVEFYHSISETVSTANHSTNTDKDKEHRTTIYKSIQQVTTFYLVVHYDTWPGNDMGISYQFKVTHGAIIFWEQRRCNAMMFVEERRPHSGMYLKLSEHGRSTLGVSSIIWDWLPMFCTCCHVISYWTLWLFQERPRCIPVASTGAVSKLGGVCHTLSLSLPETGKVVWGPMWGTSWLGRQRICALKPREIGHY